MKQSTIILKTSAFLLCGTFATTALASGFRLPEISVAGTSLSNAVVANPDLPGALPYNPAAASFQKQGELIVGVVMVQPDISADPEIGNASSSQNSDVIAIPNFFAAGKLSGNWSWAMGMNAPFGLETQWKDETFGAFNGATDAFEPEHSKIEMVNINPNIAYRFGNTSVAVGVDNYQVRNLTFNTQALNISGSGQDYGWNIGLLHVQNNWSVGLSYRSSVEVTIDGTVDPTALGPLPISAAKAKIEFPSMLQVGARYKVNKKLAVEFDVEQTGWSSFDTINIDHSSPGIPNPIVSENKWDDAIAYRLSSTYELSPTNQLRFGYAYDETPGNDEFFSARVPGNDRQTISLGLGHQQNGWTMEFAYMYVKADDRKINTGDFFDGDYKLSAHLIGIGVNTHF